MSQWYYTRKGERQGPVERGTLDMLAQSGELEPGDLVWTEGMDEWKPASSVEGLFAPAPADPANPYASPASMVETPPMQGGEGGELEILDPPAPLTIGGPLDLAVKILKKEFGMILATGVVVIGVTIGMDMLLNIIGTLLHFNQSMPVSPQAPPKTPEEFQKLMETQLLASYTGWGLVATIIRQIVNIYLGLGIARVAMDVIEGKPVKIGLLFSQGSKLLGAVGGTVFLMLITATPSIVTMIPVLKASLDGIEPTADQMTAAGIGGLVSLALTVFFYARFGFFQAAMVDGDLGVVSAFRRSARLTLGSRWKVIGLYCVIILINLAGLFTCCVGLIFTIPLTTLAWYVAYKWMLHGPDSLNRIHTPPNSHPY